MTEALSVALFMDGGTATVYGPRPGPPTGSSPTLPRRRRRPSGRRPGEATWAPSQGEVRPTGAPLIALGISSVWHQPWAEARTLVFTVLVVTHLLYPLVLGHRGRDAWFPVALQLVAVCVPAARAALETTALDAPTGCSSPRRWR
jgi:hypothetical protein